LSINYNKYVIIIVLTHDLHCLYRYEFTRLESEMLALREEHNRVKTEKENVDSGKEAFEEEIGTLKSTLERERQEFSTKIA